VRSHVGQRVQLLCEGAGEPAVGEMRLGYTPNYLPVRVRPERPIGDDRLLDVVLTGMVPGECLLLGEVVREPDQ